MFKKINRVITKLLYHRSRMAISFEPKCRFSRKHLAIVLGKCQVTDYQTSHHPQLYLHQTWHDTIAHDSPYRIIYLFVWRSHQSSLLLWYCCDVRFFFANVEWFLCQNISSCAILTMQFSNRFHWLVSRIISCETVVRWLNRADSRFAPSQRETSLQSNAVSHWLGANLEFAAPGECKSCKHALCQTRSAPTCAYVWHVTSCLQEQELFDQSSHFYVGSGNIGKSAI